MSEDTHRVMIATKPSCIDFFSLISMYVKEWCPDRHVVGHICCPKECKHHLEFYADLCADDADDALPECPCVNCANR